MLMHRVLVCECHQEVSTFNPISSRALDFSTWEGSGFLEAHRANRREVAGALEVFQAANSVEVVPGFGARSITSTGMLTAAGLTTITEGFMDAVKRHREVDGIYFSLHGAMAAEGEDDPEGMLLRETRLCVGEEVPIVVSLDLHGILTDPILRHADAVVTYHTYPHVDFYSTGQRAARVLLRILKDGARPVTARVKVPALVRGDELITETGLLGGFMCRSQELEAEVKGLSAGMFIGNPFTDVPPLNSSSLIVFDGEPERAREEALRLAQDFWALREEFHQPLVSVAEAVQIAKGTRDGTVILTDAADATSSGASGDSNVLLRALNDAGYDGTVLAPIVDREAVEAAIVAGVGENVRTTLGGQLDRDRFAPLPFEGRVHLISEGSFQNESDGMTCFAGRTAVLKSRTVTVVVTSRSVNHLDRSLFYSHGQDPRGFDVVVVKAPHCQPRFFSEWAQRVVNVDAPGSTSANLHSLGHARCIRPIYPLDDNVSFVPRVQLFSRPRYGFDIGGNA
jgi:microcystin degradation protein MlrC